ncbi:MAG: hypothetical protein WC631_00320 [Candidatus Paceibacterota bacterium]
MLEKEIKIKTRNTKIKKAVLQSIATAGILGVALVAPNVLKLFRIKNNNDKKIYINSVVSKLTKSGFLERGKNGISLTKKGERELEKIESRDYKIQKPKKWDGKWRILIFDISETKKYTRDSIRRTLMMIGFIKLQNSVWVFPYDCEDLITLLKVDLMIGKDMLYIIADKIEHDSVLKSRFGLD